jgi:hypothetical protein
MNAGISLSAETILVSPKHQQAALMQVRRKTNTNTNKPSTSSTTLQDNPHQHSSILLNPIDVVMPSAAPSATSISASSTTTSKSTTRGPQTLTSAAETWKLYTGLGKSPLTVSTVWSCDLLCYKDFCPYVMSCMYCFKCLFLVMYISYWFSTLPPLIFSS